MTSLVLQDTPVQARRRFLNQVAETVGRSNVRALWTPVASEGGTPDGVVGGRTWLHGTSPNSRLSRLGQGYALSFNGTTDFLACVDAADLSFVSGTDQPFTMVALANVTDTANARVFGAKWDNAAATEYEFRVTTADLLELLIFLPDASHFAGRASTAAVTMGTYRLFGVTYSAATGGATAANDMTLYENGAVKASAATNDALYTKMTDTASSLEIGASGAGTLRLMQGSMAMFLLCAGNLSAAKHADLMVACRNYFGVPV